MGLLFDISQCLAPNSRGIGMPSWRSWCRTFRRELDVVFRLLAMISFRSIIASITLLLLLLLTLTVVLSIWLLP